MKFHVSRSFPTPVARLWEVVVDRYADTATWDRSVHTGRPVPEFQPVDGIANSSYGNARFTDTRC